MTRSRLAISNLGWLPAEEKALLPSLAKIGMQGIEVAPSRIADWDLLSDKKIFEYRKFIESHNLVISSLQAVFFGVPNIALLQDGPSFMRLCAHTTRVADIAQALGAGPIVFGAPRVRSRGDLSPEEASAMALERMAALGDIVAAHGSAIGIEPVPPLYGGDFWETADSVIAFVRRLGHDAVRVHLDTACVTLGDGDISAAIAAAGADLVHFHLAEKDLGDFDTPRMPHEAAIAALRRQDYRGWLAIEMKAQGENNAARAETAARYAVKLLLS